MSLEPGSIIDDKYRVTRLIGEGGMGAVFQGENVRIKRQVAIKILHAKVASNAEVVQRFEREAQAAGTIGNDHILEVLDLGALPNGDRYIVMEFLEGEPLSARIERMKRIPPIQLVPLIAQLLEGLSAAHRAGITHRDLKPDNVFLLKKKAGQRDYVKIIDFGISKFAQAENGVKMTQAGVVMGTPLYMSPEQARSSEADPRSDLYSVGVIMYEAASGRVPFTGEAFNELLIQIVLGEVTPLSVAAPEVDPTFSNIVMRAMAREARDRFQTADELRSVLEEWRVTIGGGSRSTSVPPTVAMGLTPVPGQLPLTQSRAAWTPPTGQGLPPGTPYPGQPGVAPYGGHAGTPYPGQPGGPYPVQQHGTPYPGQPGNPGMMTPYPVAQGTGHAWGASQTGPHPMQAPAPASGKRTLAIVGAVGVVVLVLGAVGLTKMTRGSSAAATASAAPPPQPVAVPPPPETHAEPAATAPPAVTVAPAKEPEAPVASAASNVAPPAPATASPAPVHAHQAAATTSPKPAPARDAKPAAKPASHSSEPDFGY